MRLIKFKTWLYQLENNQGAVKAGKGPTQGFGRAIHLVEVLFMPVVGFLK